ncbi:TPA: restriction endonuclease subunit S [Streptococcus suis]
MNAQDLKNSILQLAIQGKLVEQREEEGTAKELLEKIEAEKKQLIKEGKIKKQKTLPEIKEDEIPFDIPESWEWVRLGDVFDIIMGQSPKGTSVFEGDGGIEFHQGKVYFGSDYLEYSNQSTNKPTKIVEPNTVLLCVRAPVGILNITDRQICIGRGLCGINTLAGMDSKFVMSSLRAFKYDFIRKATGTTFVAITGEVVKNQLFPLPPLEEQKRIVAKIEELMPYVDKYDVAYSEVEELNKKFPEDMQKSILQYAIQGKLVEQREEDGTAEDLYKQIQEEKKKLIKEGKIKKTKALPEITEDEIPFDIPENWKWVRLGDLCNYGKCNSTPAKNIPKDAWLLDLEDIEKDSGKVLNKKRMQDVKSTSSKHIFKEGDVLYSKLRPYLNKVVIADEDGYSTSEILPLDFGTHVYNRYAQTVLMSPYFINYTVKCSYGVKMPRLGTTDGQLAVFPLAPLEEQKRIVEKVYELLPYAKQLAKKIDHPAQG